MNLLDRPLFIKWQENSNTDIALIDEQHKGIVSIINTLYYMVGMGKGNNKLYLRIIDTLTNYSSIHFTTEEGMLEAYGFKDLEKHKALHKKLLLDMERVRHNTMNDSQPLLEFLKKWWLEHINEQDMLYAPYLRAGSKAASIQSVPPLKK